MTDTPLSFTADTPERVAVELRVRTDTPQGREMNTQLTYRQLLYDLVGPEAPLSSYGDCVYCSINLIIVGKPNAHADPAEHLSTCRWARAARFLKGQPMDGGVTP